MSLKNKRKKITFFCELAPFGGVETVFRHYCDLLNPQYELTLISACEIPENFVTFFAQNNITFFSPIKKEKFYHLVKYIIYKIKKFRLSKTLRQSDIIIDFKNGGGNKRLQKHSFTSIPKILWIHGGTPYVKKNMQNFDWSIYDKIVCLTDSLKNDLIRMFPQYQEKFTRIYNPMDINKIKRMADLPISTETDFFTHVSRLDCDKDIKTMLDGYELFYQKTHSPCQLYIIGDGTLKQTHEDYAAGLSSSRQIKFLGKKENPFPYMREAKAVVLSSPSEGLPCTLIEALACTKGTVISSDCPSGPAEILGYGKYGSLFEVGNAKQLAYLLQQSAENNLPKNFTPEELKEHLNRFDFSAVCDTLHNLLANYNSNSHQLPHRS